MNDRESRGPGGYRVGGLRLYLSGVDPQVMTQFQRAGHLPPQGPIQMVEATPHLGESTLTALHDAQAWIVGHQATDEPVVEEAPEPEAMSSWFRNLFRRR